MHQNHPALFGSSSLHLMKLVAFPSPYLSLILIDLEAVAVEI